MKRFLCSFTGLGIMLAAFLIFSNVKTDAADAQFYPALKAGGYSLPAIHTRAEIMARLKDFEAMQSGSPYAVQPVLKSPYNAGELNMQFLNHGLAAVNFYRYLAGLPSDIKTDNSWNSAAQHGSALLAIINKSLSHTPSYPAGINLPKSFYDLGYDGTSSSNLHMSQGNLAAAVGGFVFDSDSSNIDRLGHRRWVLNPSLTVTGLGFANGYAAMKVFGNTSVPLRKEVYAYCAWPAAGEMPLGYFSGSSAWSFSLNPAAFGGVKGDKKAVTVTLKRISDGRTWLFGGSSGNSGGYFNIETSGFGLPYCVIFRPDNLGMINDGEIFEVAITGVTSGSGTPIPVKYRTGFFNNGAKISSSVNSKHPRIVTMDYTWSTAKYGRISSTVTNGQLTFGYTGIPVNGFSLAADSPGGIIPIGFSVNKSEKIFGPGEWVSANGGPITSLKLLSSAGGYNITFTVFSQAKGWSAWGKPGDELTFGPSYPIESIAIWISGN